MKTLDSEDGFCTGCWNVRHQQQDSNHPDNLFQSRNNSNKKYNNPPLGHHLPTRRSSSFLIGLMVKSTTFCTKKNPSYTVEYTALSFLIQVRPHLSLKVNFVKSLPQVFATTYQMRQYMYWLWMKHVLQFFLLINGSITLWKH